MNAIHTEGRNAYRLGYTIAADCPYQGPAAAAWLDGFTAQAREETRAYLDSLRPAPAQQSLSL